MVSSTVEAPAPHDNLTEDEARERASLLSNLTYSVTLTLSDDPTAATFTSESEVTFDATADAGTFIDLAATTLDSVELNGTALDPGTHRFDGHRLRLPGLHATGNRLVVRAHCAYQVHGIGLHRTVDPVDDRVYVYTHFEPFDAHKVFACFDQPDLKGPVSMTVRAPSSWRVCSNGRVVSTTSEAAQTVTRFNTTPPLPPYLVAVIGGPYHVIVSSHKDIPLGLWCRETLVQYLEAQAADIFDVTRSGLDFFEQYFGTPYPFDEYNQLLVPEFNMGAMENPGCVTFNEAYVFRGRATETQLSRRAETILHEMAHVCGFGDVVTMRWWGDLWLNETFATYMAHLAMARATRFTNVWVDFANTVKSVAARQDQLETTHRIADFVPDTDSVRQNFDGITYHKGAAVLRQLVAWVGDDAFMRGVQDYMRRFRWGNATLDDFLDCLAHASGRDVSRFSSDWLETTGMNTLRPVLSVDDGHYAGFAVEQTAAPLHPTLRSHRLGIGLFDRDASGALHRRRDLEVDVDGPRTEIPALVGEPVADFVLVNDSDLTFAKVRFDERSVETLVESLSRLEDPLARALAWAALWDMTRDAELPARRYVEIVGRHAPGEPEILLVERVLGQATAAIDQFVAAENRGAASAGLHRVAVAQLGSVAPGTDVQGAWFRCAAVTAETDVSLEKFRALLEGESQVEGITVDREVRWLLLGVLSDAGWADAARINAEIQLDPTDIGRRRGAACLAGRPLAQAKEEAWIAITEPDAPPSPGWEAALIEHPLSLTALSTIMAGYAVVSAAVGGFMRGRDHELLRPYIARYAGHVAQVWEQRPVEEAETFTQLMFPRWFSDEESIKIIEHLITGGGLNPAAVRILREGRDGLRRSQRAQDADRRAATSSSA